MLRCLMFVLLRGVFWLLVAVGAVRLYGTSVRLYAITNSDT